MKKRKLHFATTWLSLHDKQINQKENQIPDLTHR